MSLLTLTRAARLVGITRAALQKKIKSGELPTFEGMVRPEDLTRVYPDVRLEDTTVFERLARIKDEAYTRRVRERLLPDATVLAARLAALTREHASTSDELTRHRQLLARVIERLGGIANAAELRTWLEQELALASPPVAAPSLSVRDSLLRLTTAHVRMQQSGREFLVEGADTLLDAALRAGIAVDYGCHDASCGRCRARVSAGEVKAVRSPTPDVALAADECLLCCHTAVTDIVLAAAEAQTPKDVPLQHVAAWVQGMRRPRPDLMVLGIDTGRTDRLRFLAGQTVTLAVGESLTGEYAIASCPCESGTLQFHIRHDPADPFAEHLFNTMRYGDAVTLHGPHGDFVLPTEAAGPIVCLAWETGFAPIKSLIEHALAAETAESVRLYWTAGSEEGLYLRNLCRAWADALDDFHFEPLVTAPEKLRPQLTSLLQREEELKDSHIYVAGPPAFLDATATALQDAGVPPTQVRKLAVA